MLCITVALITAFWLIVLHAALPQWP